VTVSADLAIPKAIEEHNVRHRVASGDDEGRPVVDPVGAVLDVKRKPCGYSRDRADVRMVEGSQRPRLAFEAREAVGIGRELARQDFERNVAPADAGILCRASRAGLKPRHYETRDGPAWTATTACAAADTPSCRRPAPQTACS
jgi:hypothetical protein